MTNAAGFDFTKFVPGFDFLKNLTPGGGASATSAAAPGWVAPTLDPEELEKRIQELKTVQFWLEQNSKAVGATIQALEVQRMTLQTLKGMNMSFNDLAESLKVKTQDAAQAAKTYSFTPAAPAEPEHVEPEAEPEVQAQAAQQKNSGRRGPCTLVGRVDGPVRAHRHARHERHGASRRRAHRHHAWQARCKSGRKTGSAHRGTQNTSPQNNRA